MNSEEYVRAIEYYRTLASEEMKNEKIVNGVLIGPRSEIKNKKLELKDFLTPSRPYFGNDRCKIRYSICEYLQDRSLQHPGTIGNVGPRNQHGWWNGIWN